MPDQLTQSPLCDIPGIAAFRPGEWNGDTFDAAFIRQLKENYQRFMAPDPKTGQPWYVPYVSINHDKFPHLAGFQFGQLRNVNVDRMGMLTLDANEVPGEVGQWIKSGMLRNPSIEFVRPKKDAAGKIVAGFVGPDGKFVDGPVIKCLTFLGNDIPGVKGLPELPDPVFHDRPAAPVDRFAATGGILSSFGSLAVDRNAILQALAAAGLDTSAITDAVPDVFLQAVLAMIQKGNANPPTPGPDPTMMADPLAGATATPPAAGIPGVNPAANPSSVLLKFNQQFPGLLGNLTGQIATLQASATGADRVARRIIDNAKKTAIDSFFDRMAKTGQIPTAAQPSYRALLSKCDHTDTRKFADGKRDGSELDAMMYDLESTLPKIQSFGPKTPQRPIVNGGAGGGLTPDRKARILAGAGVTPKVPANAN